MLKVFNYGTRKVFLKLLGSPLLLASLAGDLQIAPNTVRSYIDILESLNIIFAVRPFHANVARAIQKEPKIYFQDSGYAEGDEGVRLENTVAVSLKKHVSWLRDVMGETIGLHYVRTKEKKEVDFALVEKVVVTTLIEVKLSEAVPAPGLKYLSRKLPGAAAYQLVQNLRQPQSIGAIHVVGAAGWLASLSA